MKKKKSGGNDPCKTISGHLDLPSHDLPKKDDHKTHEKTGETKHMFKNKCPGMRCSKFIRAEYCAKIVLRFTLGR